ncbi:MAG: hypothetical protein ACLQOZ_03255 [Acidimicrobiales bacterium]
MFLLSYGVYQTIAWLLDWKYLSFEGDAVARMANAFYMLHSRDPHLAAVGFVWGPLSSVVDLPLLLFNSIWPALASHDVAGTTMSALAMAGAVYQLNALLREWQVNIVPRLLLTVLFAGSPMILMFGGDGMSEALYLFLMLAATRYLMRWLRDDDLASLVYAATALGFAYLERSEPVAAAAFAAPFVWWVTFSRSPGDRRTRVWAGLTDATILVAPIVTCFVAWAAISYVIVGQPFEQFTSKYGNSALIAGSHIATGNVSTRVVHELHAILYLGPALPIILLAALIMAVYRRNAQIWVLATVLGGGLAFTLLSYLDNAIFPWYRYYIMVVPIEVLLVGSMFAVPTRVRRAGDPATTGAHLRLLAQGPYAHIGPAQRTHPALGRTVSGAAIAAVVTLALLVPSIPGSLKGMDNPNIAPDIDLYVGYIFHKHLNAQDRQAKQAYGAVESIADYIDDQHLPNGDVVVDTGDNCIPNVVTNVDNPRVFVITNDRDFQRVLDDPITFGAHYLMVQGAGSVQTDAVGQQYPNIGNVSWAHLVHTFPARGYCVDFHLYKVTGHPQGTF